MPGNASRHLRNVSLVGFSLGLIGGGGSILAVPLLLYVVGVRNPHVAIGTSAFAVGVNALGNLVGHWRRGNVNWPCAAAFAAAGVLGATAGSTVGKLVDGRKLLILFALVMVAVGMAMLRPRASGWDPTVRLNPVIAGRLIAVGFVTGAISGFFGIGGGFLIVPGIMLGSGMPIRPPRTFRADPNEHAPIAASRKLSVPEGGIR
ncbi:MAG: sulfite exporter TauE/SafE family protein [Steroidobacteraceae bacterium]